VPASDKLAQSVIHFGIFEIDTATNELRRKGIKVKLQEQPFQILLALVERPQQLVTRSELKSRLWPADTNVDFDQGLNRAVAKLRDALDDPAEQPVYIQTISRKGYRFLAPVETIEAAGNRIAVPMLPTGGWAVAGGIAIIVAVITLLFLRFGQSNARAQTQIRSIAVLPFENISGDPQQEFLSDGITDALITELAELKEVSVLSRASVMGYKGRQVPLTQIAQALKVDALIEGTTIRSEDTVRITVQLVSARNGTHVWAQTYEHPFNSIIALQDNIAKDVSEQIHANLQLGQASKRETNGIAYEAYLRGRSYVFAGFDTPQTLRRSQHYFEQAIQADPNFAPAYSGLAESYVLLSEFRWLSPNDAYRPAREAIKKALQLDPTIGEAHTALGWLSWRHEWDWQTAEKEYRYGCELSPNDVDAYQALTWFLAWRGRTAEALEEIARIRQIDPTQVLPLDEAGIYYHQRNYKSLVEVGQKSVTLRPDFWVSHYFLGVGYEGSGQLPAAIAEYKKAAEMSQGDTDPTAQLAHGYAVAGQRAEAEQILGRLQENAKTRYVSPYMIATIYAGLGQKEKAFYFLEKAYAERSTDLPYFLKADVRLDQIRSDPRFHDLFGRLSLPN
jgi:TolB-like protein/DNA-binding winged helix-turn-helix (wHTH) protein/Tfp pilus assembly protein PilF